MPPANGASELQGAQECLAPRDAPSRPVPLQRTAGSHCPGSFPGPATSRRGEAVGSRRAPLSARPTHHLLRAWGSRWAPDEVADGMGRGGSFGMNWEWDRRPASSRRTPEPGDPAIDSNREAAVYSNTAPPGPSPGDAVRPGAPSSWRGRPPSPLPRGLGLPGPRRPLPPPDIIRRVRGLSAARARGCALTSILRDANPAGSGRAGRRGFVELGHLLFLHSLSLAEVKTEFHHSMSLVYVGGNLGALFFLTSKMGEKRKNI